MSSAPAFKAPSYRFDALVVLAALAAGLLAPSQWLTFSFMVTGIAHFFIASLYQHRAGKMTNRYLAGAGLLLLALATYVYLMGEQGVWMFLLVAFLFPIHFAVDEVTLHGERMTPHVLSTVAGFSAVAFLMVVKEVSPAGLWHAAYGAAALLFVCGALARLVFSRAPIARSEYYLGGVGLVIMLMAAFGRPMDALPIIILLHVFDWAVGYARKLAGNPERLYPYLRLTAVANLGALVAAIAFFSFQLEPLRYFFLFFYYDAWASAHILLSFKIFGRRLAAA